MQNTANVLGIFLSFSYSLISKDDGLEILSYVTGFIGALLTLSLVLKNLADFKLQYIEAARADIKRRRELLEEQRELKNGIQTEPTQGG